MAKQNGVGQHVVNHMRNRYTEDGKATFLARELITETRFSSSQINNCLQGLKKAGTVFSAGKDNAGFVLWSLTEVLDAVTAPTNDTATTNESEVKPSPHPNPYAQYRTDESETEVTTETRKPRHDSPEFSQFQLEKLEGAIGEQVANAITNLTNEVTKALKPLQQERENRQPSTAESFANTITQAVVKALPKTPEGPEKDWAGAVALSVEQNKKNIETFVSAANVDRGLMALTVSSVGKSMDELYERIDQIGHATADTLEATQKAEDIFKEGYQEGFADGWMRAMRKFEQVREKLEAEGVQRMENPPKAENPEPSERQTRRRNFASLEDVVKKLSNGN